MNVDSILARLRGVRRNGGGWMARCPSHEDRNPSLSISVNDGTILLHCHAGCSKEAVFAALKIAPRDLFSDAGKGAPEIVEAYDYLDEKFVLLYQVVRYEPKGFRQRRPDGNGGWHWNLSGVRRVLYRLPEALAEQSLLVCEGEKDCETARALGFVATCNAGGAGKWRAEYSEHLRGKEITIIADADESGRKHAQQVAESLYLRAESVKVLELPNAKDLSEWVEQGGVKDALLELIRQAPKWTATSQAVPGFVLTHLADLLARPDAPVEYVVENLLVAGTVSCVVAKPKVGKSTFARNLCLSVARGTDFLGLRTKQGECIYFALEEREEDLKNDFRAMGADGSEPIYVHAASAPADGMDAPCELVRRRRPVLVVIDPLFRLARIRDEKAYAETYAALGPLIDIAREAGAHVLLVHHAGKSAKVDAIDSPLGSTAIGGAVCTVVLLKKQIESCTRTLQTVSRIGQDIPETVLQFDLASHSLTLGARKDEADVQDLAGKMLEYLSSVAEVKTEPEITAEVEGTLGLKRKALRALVDQQKVSREGRGKRGDPYKYTLSFSCSQGMPQTSERETQKGSEHHTNTHEILVPESSSDSILVPGEKQFEEGEL
jgi:putative DNA primase/helicase